MSQIDATAGPYNPGYSRSLNTGGLFVPTGFMQGTTVALVANRGYFARCAPSEPTPINKINFGVTVVAGAADKCMGAVYNNDITQRLAVSTEKEILQSLNVRTIELPEFILMPNEIYFIAFAVGAIGGTAAQVGMPANNNGLFGDLPGTALTKNRSMLIASNAFPLPNGAVAGLAAGQVPTMWVGK